MNEDEVHLNWGTEKSCKPVLQLSERICGVVAGLALQPPAETKHCSTPLKLVWCVRVLIPEAVLGAVGAAMCCISAHSLSYTSYLIPQIRQIIQLSKTYGFAIQGPVPLIL